MSLYLNNSNQELLWSKINKTPLIERIKNKEEWFRSIIELFHNNYGKITDFQSLQKINRETIKYMIEYLQTLTSSNETSEFRVSETSPRLQNSNFIAENRYLTKEEEQIKKQELYNLAFEEKNKQYQMLNKKPTVPEVNFLEKLNDEPITNIQELVEKHRKEREEEYSIKYPNPFVGETLSSSTPEFSESETPLRLQTLSSATPEFSASETSPRLQTLSSSNDFAIETKKILEEFKGEIIFLKNKIASLEKTLLNSFVCDSTSPTDSGVADEKVSNMIDRKEEL